MDTDTEKGQPTTLRPVVALFAQAMESELRENDHKGGWQGMTLWSLMQRLGQETKELYEAALKKDAEATLSEAADVANFVMMIADNAGGLQAQARANEQSEPTCDWCEFKGTHGSECTCDADCGSNLCNYDLTPDDWASMPAVADKGHRHNLYLNTVIDYVYTVSCYGCEETWTHPQELYESGLADGRGQ